MRLNKLFLIFSFLVLIILTSNLCTSLLQSKINISPIFYNGDKIQFSYSFLSDQDEDITCYVNVLCENNPLPLSVINQLALKKDDTIFENYSGWTINNNSISGNCLASISVLEPFNLNIEEPFVINTLKLFSLNLILNKKIFAQNENITIDYSSSVENPLIYTILIYPNKDINQINLPYLFNPDQIGTYTLNITSSKEGYKTITETEQFGVIESDVQINYNAPKTESKDILQQNNKKIWFYVLIGSVIFIIIILIFIAYNLLKKN